LSTVPQTAATAAHFTQRVRHRIRCPDTVGGALLAGTAAVGSYTAFSTWMLETPLLAEERQRRVAATNNGASVILGLTAALLGRTIVERI
jgi:fluoride ion exporter CrcB/FEX